VIISLNSVNQLIVVMVKFDVLFEVRTEFLNNIYDELQLQRVNAVLVIFYLFMCLYNQTIVVIYFLIILYLDSHF
jgi:hypothetical protein